MIKMGWMVMVKEIQIVKVWARARVRVRSPARSGGVRADAYTFHDRVFMVIDYCPLGTLFDDDIFPVQACSSEETYALPQRKAIRAWMSGSKIDS